MLHVQSCSFANLNQDYGRDPFNQNSNQSDREKWSTSKGGPVFSKLFRLDRTDPLSFGPKFPEILVEWIAPYGSCLNLLLFWRSRCRRHRRPRCLSSLLKTMRIQNFGGNVKMGNFEKFYCSKKSILSLFVSGCSNSWPSRWTTEWQTDQETEKVVSATRKTL